MGRIGHDSQMDFRNGSSCLFSTLVYHELESACDANALVLFIISQKQRFPRFIRSLIKTRRWVTSPDVLRMLGNPPLAGLAHNQVGQKYLALLPPERNC